MRDTRSLADNIYLGFCEAEGGTNCLMQQAWNECEDRYGTIQAGSPISKLVYEAMVYALDKYVGDEDSEDSFDIKVTLLKGEGVFSTVKVWVSPRLDSKAVFDKLPILLRPTQFEGGVAVYPVGSQTALEVSEAIAIALSRGGLTVLKETKELNQG